MRKLGNLFILGLSSFLMACSVGPDYERPPADVPLTYKETTPGDWGIWKVASPEQTYNRYCWWRIFNDDLLNDLEEQATKYNPSIAVALAQYEEALAVVDEAAAGFYPVVTGGYAGSKTGTRSPAANGIPAETTQTKLSSIGMQAAWDVDLWGSVRRLVEEDAAIAESDAALLAGVRLSTQAMLAQDYFQLRALDELQDAFDESVKQYEKFIKITRNQYNAGVANQLALLQAEAQLEALQVLAYDNYVVRAQLEHAIAVLINKAPSEFSIKKKPTKLVPPKIPVEVPSTILERRPDIASAEQLMAAANAQIGVATAAFYPVLNLTGYRNQYLKALSAPAAIWGLGTTFIETFFDGGLRAATLEAANAAYRATLATYRQTVLSAFQDVEDNLSTLRILKNEQDAQTKALNTANKQLKFTMHQYEAGLATSLDVINALFNVYVAQRGQYTIASRQMTSAVGLLRSLG